MRSLLVRHRLYVFSRFTVQLLPQKPGGMGQVGCSEGRLPFILPPTVLMKGGRDLDESNRTLNRLRRVIVYQRGIHRHPINKLHRAE